MSARGNTKILCLFYILPIVIITIIFYWDGLHTYFNLGLLCDFGISESARSGLYLAGQNHVRAVKYALLDTLRLLFGLNPLPYHIVVLFIHIINSVLVLFIARKIADNRLIGFITAVLFTTFWAHTEPIVGVVHVHEMLLASFILSTLIFFYRYRQNPTRLNYFLVLFFALLAMGTKETAPIILVPLIYLTDRYIQFESPGLSRNKVSYIPLILLSLGLLAYLRFGPVHDAHVEGLVHYDKAISNFVRWISFTFSFPFLSDEPRWGNVNLILLALFYFLSPLQIRNILSLLMAALALLAIPIAPLGSPGARYLYLSGFFSMAIFGLMFYHGTTRLVGVVKVKEDFSRVMVVIFCTVFVYYNYAYVNKLIEYYDRTGKVTEDLLKAVSSDFPNNTLNTHLIFVNWPRELKDEHSTLPEYSIGGIYILPFYYGQSNVGQVSQVNLLEVYHGKYKLAGVRKITPLEFDKLTREKGNRVYFFNSKDDSIHDVTGKDYTHLKEFFDGNR